MHVYHHSQIESSTSHGVSPLPTCVGIGRRPVVHEAIHVLKRDPGRGVQQLEGEV